MPYITVGRENSCNIVIQDWGDGQPVVSSHGWHMSTYPIEEKIFFLASRGYCCIAHDWCGYGHSTLTK